MTIEFKLLQFLPGKVAFLIGRSVRHTVRRRGALGKVLIGFHALSSTTHLNCDFNFSHTHSVYFCNVSLGRMAEEGDSQDLLTPFEIIFSCSICQATVRNLYRNAPHEGLIDGRGNGRAPRLWLAECGHVSCGEHFEGGG